MSDITSERFYEYAYELGITRKDLEYVVALAEATHLLTPEEEEVQEVEKKLFEREEILEQEETVNVGGTHIPVGEYDHISADAESWEEHE